MDNSSFSPGAAIISVIVVLVLLACPRLLFGIIAVLGVMLMAVVAVGMLVLPVALLYYLIQSFRR